MLTEDAVRDALKTVVDPELDFDIIALGLVYDIAIKGPRVHVTMTLTTPFCPYAPELLQQAENAVRNLPGVEDVWIQTTFTPPWDAATHANDDVKAMLGIW